MHKANSPALAHEYERYCAASALAYIEIRQEILSTVQPQDFTLPVCRAIIEAIAEDVDKPEEAIFTQLVSSHKSTPDALLALVPAYCSRASTGSHLANMVREQAKRRELRASLTALSAQLDGEDVSATKMARLMMAELTPYAIDNQSRRLRGQREIAHDWLKERDDPNARKRVSTGYPDLDAYFGGGLRPGHLCVLAGRPSVGKTTLALNMAHNAAVKGHKVAFFCMEMSDQELYKKILAASTKTSLNDIEREKWTPELTRKLSDAVQDNAEKPLFIDDTADLGIAQITAKCRQMASSDGLDAVFVDYLQLMRVAKRKNSTRAEEVGELSRGLKVLAGELRVPVVALSQFNRNAVDVQPSMSDLRDSGCIEQDADQVLLLWKQEPTSELVYCDIAKNRLGMSAVRVYFLFKSEWQLYLQSMPPERPQ